MQPPFPSVDDWILSPYRQVPQGEGVPPFTVMPPPSLDPNGMPVPIPGGGTVQGLYDRTNGAAGAPAPTLTQPETEQALVGRREAPPAPPPPPDPLNLAAGAPAAMAPMGPPADAAPPPAPPPPAPQMQAPVAQPSPPPVRRGGGGGGQGDMFAGLNAAQQAEVAGVNQATAAEQAYNTKFADATRVNMAKEAVEREKVNGELADVFAKADQRAAQITGEIEALGQTRIDPNRVWNQASTGQKIGAVLLMAIGGLAQSKHGPNVMMQTLNGIIERDVNAQMQNLQTRRQSLTMAQEQMRNDLARGMTMAEVREKAIATKWMAAAQTLQLDLTPEKNAMLAGNAQKLLGGIQAKYADSLAKLQIDIKQIAAQNFATSSANKRHMQSLMMEGAQLGASVVDKSLDRSSREKLQGNELAVRGQAANREMQMKLQAMQVFGAKTSDGRPIFAPDEIVARDLNTKHGRTMSVVQNLAIIKDLRERFGVELSSWTSEAQQYGEALMVQTVKEMSKMADQGVVNKADWEKEAKTFGSINGIIDNSARLDALLGDAKRSMFHDIKARTGQTPQLSWDTAPGGTDFTGTGETQRKSDERMLKWLGFDPANFER